jgi:hypothetical protein
MVIAALAPRLVAGLWRYQTGSCVVSSPTVSGGNRFVCGIQVLSFGTIVNGNAMTSDVGHTVRSNGFGRAI